MVIPEYGILKLFNCKCNGEFPGFQTLDKQHKHNGISFVPLNAGVSKENVKEGFYVQLLLRCPPVCGSVQEQGCYVQPRCPPVRGFYIYSI